MSSPSIHCKFTVHNPPVPQATYPPNPETLCVCGAPLNMHRYRAHPDPQPSDQNSASTLSLPSALSNSTASFPPIRSLLFPTTTTPVPQHIASTPQAVNNRRAEEAWQSFRSPPSTLATRAYEPSPSAVFHDPPVSLRRTATSSVNPFLPSPVFPGSRLGSGSATRRDRATARGGGKE